MPQPTANIQLAGLVPAYQPEAALIGIAAELLAANIFQAIVVVNDGSGAEKKGIFQALADMGCIIIDHSHNQGKGAALKTGLAHIREHYPDCAGIVAFDADGQHAPCDIIATARAFAQKPEALMLGSREFKGSIPLRSLIGNKLTRAAMALFCGISLADTQTGLRAAPAALIPHLLKIRANGYEFELEMLLAAKQANIPICENKIAAIYDKGNSSSHFNPVLDSIKIYLSLFKFGASALFSALIDYAVFAICIFFGYSIFSSIVICRAASSFFNFLANRRLVFGSDKSLGASAAMYYALAALSALLSWLFITLLVKINVNALIAKIISETALFLLNFIIQRDFIFKK